MTSPSGSCLSSKHPLFAIRDTTRHHDQHDQHDQHDHTTTMATRETADLGEAHPPRHESIRAFDEMAHELRRELVHLRHQHDKHVPESFAAAKHLADHELAAFSADDFVLVRVATTAYGLILFGKLRIPALAEDAADTSPAYIHFRAFTDGPEQAARFHSFYTEELDTPTTEGDGHLKTYRTLFSRADVLDWFDA